MSVAMPKSLKDRDFLRRVDQQNLVIDRLAQNSGLRQALETIDASHTADGQISGDEWNAVFEHLNRLEGPSDTDPTAVSLDNTDVVEDLDEIESAAGLNRTWGEPLNPHREPPRLPISRPTPLASQTLEQLREMGHDVAWDRPPSHLGLREWQEFLNYGRYADARSDRLGLGTYGAQVEEVQQTLIDAGLLDRKDGLWGIETELAYQAHLEKRRADLTVERLAFRKVVFEPELPKFKAIGPQSLLQSPAGLPPVEVARLEEPGKIEEELQLGLPLGEAVVSIDDDFLMQRKVSDELRAYYAKLRPGQELRFVEVTGTLETDAGEIAFKYRGPVFGNNGADIKKQIEAAIFDPPFSAEVARPDGEQADGGLPQGLLPGEYWELKPSSEIGTDITKLTLARTLGSNEINAKWTKRLGSTSHDVEFDDRTTGSVTAGAEEDYSAKFDLSRPPQATAFDQLMMLDDDAVQRLAASSGATELQSVVDPTFKLDVGHEREFDNGTYEGSVSFNHKGDDKNVIAVDQQVQLQGGDVTYGAGQSTEVTLKKGKLEELELIGNLSAAWSDDDRALSVNVEHETNLLYKHTRASTHTTDVELQGEFGAYGAELGFSQTIGRVGFPGGENFNVRGASHSVGGTYSVEGEDSEAAINLGYGVEWVAYTPDDQPTVDAPPWLAEDARHMAFDSRVYIERALSPTATIGNADDEEPLRVSGSLGATLSETFELKKLEYGQIEVVHETKGTARAAMQVALETGEDVSVAPMLRLSGQPGGSVKKTYVFDLTTRKGRRGYEALLRGEAEAGLLPDPTVKTKDRSKGGIVGGVSLVNNGSIGRTVSFSLGRSGISGQDDGARGNRIRREQAKKHDMEFTQTQAGLSGGLRGVGEFSIADLGLPIGVFARAEAGASLQYRSIVGQKRVDGELEDVNKTPGFRWSDAEAMNVGDEVRLRMSADALAGFGINVRQLFLEFGVGKEGAVEAQFELRVAKTADDKVDVTFERVTDSQLGTAVHGSVGVSALAQVKKFDGPGTKVGASATFTIDMNAPNGKEAFEAVTRLQLKRAHAIAKDNEGINTDVSGYRTVDDREDFQARVLGIEVYRSSQSTYQTSGESNDAEWFTAGHRRSSRSWFHQKRIGVSATETTTFEETAEGRQTKVEDDFWMNAYFRRGLFGKGAADRFAERLKTVDGLQVTKDEPEKMRGSHAMARIKITDAGVDRLLETENPVAAYGQALAEARDEAPAAWTTQAGFQARGLLEQYRHWADQPRTDRTEQLLDQVETEYRQVTAGGDLHQDLADYEDALAFGTFVERGQGAGDNRHEKLIAWSEFYRDTNTRRQGEVLDFMMAITELAGPGGYEGYANVRR